MRDIFIIFFAKKIKNIRLLLGLFVLLGSVGQASALETDLFESKDFVKFDASAGYTFNSNLFMLPSGVNTQGNNAERSDSILATRLGVKASQDVGMQHFNFKYSHVNAKYSNFSFLDYDSDSYGANWLWSLTPALTGNLFTTRDVSARSAEVYGRTAPITGRQMTTDRSTGMDFDFSPHHIFHLYGGYMNHDINMTGQTGPDYSQSWYETSAGLGYEFSSGTLIKLMHLDKNGKQAQNDSRMIGQNFNGKETQLSILWPVSGKSSVNASIGYATRNDESYAERNYSGLVGNIQYIKELDGQNNLALSYNRRLVIYQTSTQSHAEVDEISISDTWAATSKLNIKASIIVDQRRYANVNLPGSPVRDDNNLRYGLDATWQSSEKIKVRALIERSQRNSNAADFVFNANVASISAELNF